MVNKEALYRMIGKRITDAMKQQGVTTLELSERCRQSGFQINHSTISKIRQGLASMSVMNLVYICKELNLDLNEVFSLEEQIHTKEKSGDDTLEVSVARVNSYQKRAKRVFITDPNDWRIAPYLGDYHGYYCSAAIPRDKVEEVAISIFNPGNGSQQTEVRMMYKTPFMGRSGQEYLERLYCGSLTLSEKAETVYCSMSCNETGKQFHFAFLHDRKVYEIGELKSIVCAVLTTNRGDNHAPTIQRMILTRKRLVDEEIRHLQSQLKMNSQMILISKIALKDAVQDPRCSNLIKSRLCDEGDVNEWVNQQQYTPYCEIGEAFFDTKFTSESDRANVVNVLREYSRDVYYNKVGRKASLVLQGLQTHDDQTTVG